MAKHRRQLTLLICAAVTLVLLSPVVFITVEAHHDCIGEDCHICLEIRSCVELLHGLGMAFVAAAAVASLFLALSLPRRSVFAAARAITLVSLKVKLSN